MTSITSTTILWKSVRIFCAFAVNLLLSSILLVQLCEIDVTSSAFNTITVFLYDYDNLEKSFVIVVLYYYAECTTKWVDYCCYASCCRSGIFIHDSATETCQFGGRRTFAQVGVCRFYPCVYYYSYLYSLRMSASHTCSYTKHVCFTRQPIEIK